MFKFDQNLKPSDMKNKIDELINFLENAKKRGWTVLEIDISTPVRQSNMGDENYNPNFVTYTHTKEFSIFVSGYTKSHEPISQRD